MNREIANSMLGYLETLYNCNKNIIKLCGLDIMYGQYNYTNIILSIIQDIPRLIPYCYNNENNSLEVSDKDGLIEFNSELNDIKTKYEEILKKNNCSLDKIRKIRNKYEHKMHNIKEKGNGSGTSTLFDFTFDVNGEQLDICAFEIINIFKELNILYSRIVEDIKKYAVNNNLTEYRYYQRICRFDFNDFNDIYDSKLINKIGKIMDNF